MMQHNPNGHPTLSPRPRRNDLHQLDVYRCALELYRMVDQLAPQGEIFAAQDLADRVAAMLTKLIRSAEAHSL